MIKSLTLTTFNIRCFGFNGDYFSPTKSESRLSYLKNFIAKHFSDTDVFVLQEIMDLSLLEHILPLGFKSYSYPHNYPRHMHVVLCCRAGLEFGEVQVIPYTTIDETTSRPALYGVLQHRGQPIMQVVGVHLKSDYNNTDNRLSQARHIAEFLKQHTLSLPTLIAGDFNSHLNQKTKRNQNDLFYLEDIFSTLNLKRVSGEDFTYITSYERAHLDHVWTDLSPLRSATYNYGDYATADEALKRYFDEISDHLPVTVELDLKLSTI